MNNKLGNKWSNKWSNKLGNKLGDVFGSNTCLERLRAPQDEDGKGTQSDGFELHVNRMSLGAIELSVLPPSTELFEQF